MNPAGSVVPVELLFAAWTENDHSTGAQIM